MRLSVLSSGSSGNVTYIESGGRGLLVDAGLSCRRIKALLTRIGRSLADVEVILLTHGHGDHTSGVRSLLRERPLPVYAAPGVWDRPDVRVIEPGEPFPAGEIEAAFFSVPHDTPTYGVRLSNGRSDVALATDLGEITPEALRWMRGADAVVLEANHDEDWLRRGPYSADLKRRVASAAGHLSNHQAAQAAVALAPYGLKDLVLAHLSEKNNSAPRATGTVSRALRAAGYDGVRVRAALAKHPTPWVEVGALPEGREYVYRYEREATVQRLFEVE